MNAPRSHKTEFGTVYWKTKPAMSFTGSRINLMKTNIGTACCFASGLLIAHIGKHVGWSPWGFLAMAAAALLAAGIGISVSTFKS